MTEHLAARLDGYFYFHGTRGAFLLQLGRKEEAQTASTAPSASPIRRRKRPISAFSSIGWLPEPICPSATLKTAWLAIRHILQWKPEREAGLDPAGF
jgi:hypothetical protein